jgi:hypothetical protein
LGEESDPQPRRPHDETVIGLQRPGQDFQERRLPFPVPTHQPDPLPLFDLEVGTIQKGTLTK